MWLVIVTAGIAGTAAMTLFMYGLSYVFNDVFKVSKILGTLLTNRTTPTGHLSDSTLSVTTGIIAHYLIGVGFVVCYHWLWQREVGEPTWQYGTLFGFVSGLIGMLVWRVTFWLHPNPPKTVDLPSYFAVLVAAHLIFGATAAVVYKYGTGLL